MLDYTGINMYLRTAYYSSYTVAWRLWDILDGRAYIRNKINTTDSKHQHDSHIDQSAAELPA